MRFICRSVRGVCAFLVDIFGAEKAPYMLTIFIAAAGWTIVRTTDRLTGLPLAEYRVSEEGATDPHRMAIRLRNITSAVKFGCFNLTVASATNSSLRFDVTKPHSILIRGGVLAKVAKQSLDADVALFKVQDFAPGADVELSWIVVGVDEPRLLISSCSADRKGDSTNAKDSRAGDSEPILIRRSIKSMLVEYEMYVLWCGLAVWLALLLVTFLAGRHTVPSGKD